MESQIGDLSGNAITERDLEDQSEPAFAGLDDGTAENEDGNTVCIHVEGDAENVLGFALNEYGDVIDKYGKVRGHAEPYVKREESNPDLSSLDGKIIAKASNVVDDLSTIFGCIEKGRAEMESYSVKPESCQMVAHIPLKEPSPIPKSPIVKRS